MRDSLIASATKTLLAATALGACWCLPASAQSTWIGPGGNGDVGLWGTPSNWAPSGIPNAAGAEVLLTQNPGIDSSIDLAGSVFTIGTMRVNTPTNYVIGSGGAGAALNFQVGAGNALIEVTQVGTINPLFAATDTGGSPITVNLVSNTNATVAAGQRLWFGDATTLGGAGELIANGTGTVRIDAASTRTNITRLVSGTLEIGNVGALGSDQLRVTNGTLRANTTGTLANNILVENNGSMATIVGNGQTVTHTGGTTLNNNVGSLSFGQTGGTGTFVMAGFQGSVSNPASFTVDVLGGTLRGTGLKLGFFTSFAAATNVAAGATLEFASVGFNDSEVKNLQSAGTVDVGPGASLSIGGGSASGAITGAGSMRVANPAFFTGASGNLVLTGTNTYSGGTTINAGAVLQLGNNSTAGSIVGNAVNNGSLIFSRSNTYQFDGAISGSGNLVQAGSGTTILTASNTYTGTTNVNAGTLALGAGGTTGSIVGNVANNGNLVFSRSNNYQFDGAISGSGNVIQAGSGTTILTATNTYTGTTNVNAGTLRVDGDTSASAFTVNAGGTLGGNGTVGNVTINGGVLAPGSSIGLLNVQGSLSFTAASSYMIEVSPVNADRTNVTGTATLGSATVNATFAAGTYVNRQYTILHANGGVAGAFAGPVVTNLPSGFQSSLSYDANNVYLNLILGFGNAGALNQNQQNVANALINFFNTTGGIPFVFGALSPGGLTQVSGEAATGSQQATFNAMGLFMGLLTDPFLAGRGDGAGAGLAATPFAEEGDASAYASSGKRRSSSEREAHAAVYRKASIRDNYDPRWSVWAAGFGGSQTTDGNTTIGSNNSSSRVFGVAAGADYIFSPRTIAGFALAGGGTNFSVANGGSGRSELFQAGAFVRHTVGPAYITAALAYGWQDITTDRTVTVAGVDRLRAQFNANAWSGRVEGGYRFVAQGIGLTPYAAGQFTTFQLPGYAEAVISGANTFALSYAAKDVTASRSELGLRSDKSFAVQDGIFTLRGRAAWAHNFNTDRSALPTFQALPGASFVVNGASQAADAALVTAAAEMKWLNGFSVAGTFEGEYSNVTHSYAGKGVVRYAW